jgi:hypothetical protein
VPRENLKIPNIRPIKGTKRKSYSSGAQSHLKEMAMDVGVR